LDMEQKEVDLWQLSDLCTPWCLHVIVTLRIADHIAAGTDRIDELAAAAGCDAYVLHGMLGRLIRKGVFEEPEPGRFSLNEPARQLLDPTIQLSMDLEGIGGRFAHAWGTMLAYARTGAPAYDQIFGRPFWEDLDAHPKLSADFDALIGPAGHGTPSAEFEITGGWESIKTVVDVGGGTGAMLAEILRLRPEIEGVLVDQPNTVARSSDIFQDAGVTERVTTAGQSFFDPLPPGHDLYLLRGIVNDWPDREAQTLLARCAEAASPGGRVVILGGVRSDDVTRDVTIEMILLGGKHRSLDEMRELAGRAGMEVVAAGKQPAGYFVTECRPI
jgi:2,7-dihydroxy-5-methyl-1-naphthoate 7-O-methyltransferase